MTLAFDLLEPPALNSSTTPQSAKGVSDAEIIQIRARSEPPDHQKQKQRSTKL